MKVIILNDFSYVDGGASKVAIDSASLLSKKNIDVRFVSFCNHNKSIEGINHINFSDITSNTSNIALKALNTIYNFQSLGPLHDFLKAEIDSETIVHLHVWVKNMSPKIFKILHDLQVKFVVTAHDYFLACPNGGFYNYSEGRHCNLKPLSLECWQSNCDKRNYAQHIYRCIRHSVQHRILYEKPINCIFVSKYSEQILKPHLKLKFFKTIGNPVNIPSNIIKNSANKNGKCIYVGRLEKEKGVHHLAEAFNNFSKTLTIVGSGSQEDKLKKISTNIEFLGWQGKENVTKLIRDASLLIFPSLWHETFGLTVFEAGSVGTPSLVSDKCATSGFITHESNGLIYEGGNIASLRKNVENFFRNQNLQKKITENCYSLAQQYKNENYITELIGFYSHIIDHA